MDDNQGFEPIILASCAQPSNRETKIPSAHSHNCSSKYAQEQGRPKLFLNPAGPVPNPMGFAPNHLTIFPSHASLSCTCLRDFELHNHRKHPCLPSFHHHHPCIHVNKPESRPRMVCGDLQPGRVILCGSRESRQTR